MRPVVVLRPEPGNATTVGRARELGLQALACPLFAIEAVAWSAPDPAGFDGLLLTSANAVRNAGAGLLELASLQVYAVGQATAAAARSLNLSVRKVGTAGVDALLGELPAGLRLLHLSGEDRQIPSAPRQQITHLSVYRAIALGDPNLATLAGAVALVHSPRAGSRLAELMAERRHTAIAAISPAAASVCGVGWAAVAAADSPTDEALLSLAASMCQQSPPE